MYAQQATTNRRSSTGNHYAYNSSLPAFGSDGYGFADQTTFGAGLSVGCNDDVYFKDKPRQRRHPFLDMLLQPQALLGMIGFLLLALMMQSRAQKAWLLKEMQVTSIAEALEAWHELKADHHEVSFEAQHHYEVAEKLEERDAAWKAQMELLVNATKKEAHRAVVDKFGTGPHRVRFAVQMPNSPHKQTFDVEMAPIKYMPHAVHLFLEQVAHGLWNNSAFHLNYEHVLQVGPSTREHRQRFRDYELDRLAFPEYSEQFPHKQWTLGFAGRPGGPSWYINKLDNQDDHGPYGQGHHALSEFADSCFGKVVDGFETLEKVFMGHDNTSIVSAVIANWEDHWSDEEDEDWHSVHEEFDDSDDDSQDDDDWLHSEDHADSKWGDGHVHRHASHVSVNGNSPPEGRESLSVKTPSANAGVGSSHSVIKKPSNHHANHVEGHHHAAHHFDHKHDEKHGRSRPHPGTDPIPLQEMIEKIGKPLQ